MTETKKLKGILKSFLDCQKEFCETFLIEHGYSDDPKLRWKYVDHIYSEDKELEDANYNGELIDRLDAILDNLLFQSQWVYLVSTRLESNMDTIFNLQEAFTDFNKKVEEFLSELNWWPLLEGDLCNQLQCLSELLQTVHKANMSKRYSTMIDVQLDLNCDGVRIYGWDTHYVHSDKGITIHSNDELLDYKDSKYYIVKRRSDDKVCKPSFWCNPEPEMKKILDKYLLGL